MKVLMIQRASVFSPNSVEKDLAILEAVGVRLCAQGHEVITVSEDGLSSLQYKHYPDVCPDLILTMGRLSSTLSWQKSLGIRTINSPGGIENCARKRLQHVMAQVGTPVPPREGTSGYWLKRGDVAAQSKDDVVFARDEVSLMAAIRRMVGRGVQDYTVSAHVVGDLVKFYGVRGTGFFRCYYPTDDRQTKFGDEQHNGAAHHYAFSLTDMQQQAERLAEAVGIEIYGGDCIVREDGSFCVIDFNDWPSFSRCREEAADAIASII